MADGSGDGKTPTRESILAEFRDEFTALMKTGGVEAREREFFKKLFKLRGKNRELEEQLAKVQGAAPKDGQVLLSKEDAAEFAAFKKLNLKAADLATIVTEHGEQKTRLAERDAEELYVEVADALGFENLPAFMRYMEREGLHVEFQDAKEKDEETGKTVTVRVPMVRDKNDDKAQLEPLPEYLEREVPEFIDAFTNAPTEEGEEGGSPYSDGAGGASAYERQLARYGAGDAGARRAAGVAGVTMPVSRNARPSNGASRNEKAREERIAAKRALYPAL